ncbi:MAG: nicotinate-nucleotide--dimethylbenzimidazole phosphoribosyltransferase, partial [Acidaminococcaceae bacterium]|nr:nicotinate-nucleotide--dimethylbenzimidazole phosphoribosyltransferase [Acidaminococcaceae bacterium]
MHIEELVTKIQPLSSDIIKAARNRFDNLIKPVGSLAQLEDMTARYAGILGSSDKRLVVIPETRLLLLWGEAKHAADIEAAMLQKKAVSVYASHVNAKVIPLLVIGESAYDLLEEGAMLTGEYIGE